MNYELMIKAIAEDHSIQMCGTFEETKASDSAMAELELRYPDLYAKALADYNEMLRKM
jgi:hypothetical protein